MRNPIMILFVAIVVAGCGSVGSTQLPVNENPVSFVDGRSGASLGSVLLIPKYTASTGMSSGAGHGPGNMTSQSFLASPAVYDSGQPLRVQQPDSNGLVPGPVFFAGRGITLDGLIVLAPNYEGIWFWRLWERPMDARVPMVGLGDGGEANRTRMLALLEQPRIRGVELSDAERHIFSIIREFDIELKFTANDRRLVREFMLQPPRP